MMTRFILNQMALKPSLLALAVLFTPAFAQQPEPDSNWEPGRTEFGAPDLQGVWNIATLTNLERDSHFDSLVISDEEAARIEMAAAAEVAEDDQPAAPDRGAPEAGGGVGGYNAFWTDPGNALTVVNGEKRTSIIVEPEDGRLPLSDQGRDRFREWGRRPAYAGPEMRPLGERCLVGFGSSGGPPMLPVLYNNHSQIVQTEDYVMILAEMNHDARIIRMAGEGETPEHEEPPMNRWMGDSVGYYEGDTLVVETSNFHPQQSYRFSLRHRLYLSPDAKVTERFTRVAPDQILYQFTVEDPKAYTQAWKGELTMRSVDEKIFEYACHEGNYALPGILAGARVEEQRQEQEGTQ